MAAPERQAVELSRRKMTAEWWGAAGVRKRMRACQGTDGDGWDGGDGGGGLPPGEGYEWV